MTSIPVLGVFYIEPLSESLHYRPYLDLVENRPFMEWCAGKVSGPAGASQFVVVCHTKKEEQALKSLRLPDNFLVHVTTTFSQRQALASLAQNASVSILALLPWGIALAPPDLLKKMVDHHVSTHNTYTVAAGFPGGVAPVLFNKSLLISLNECKLLGLPTDTQAALETLVRAARSTQQELPFAVRCRPFEANVAYEPELPPFHRELTLNSPAQIELIREVFLRLKATENGSIEALRLYKQIQVDQTERFRRQVHDWNLSLSKIRPKSILKRVLFVSNASAFSGAEESLCQLIQQLDKSRFESYALLGKEGVFADRLRDAGVSVQAYESDFSLVTTENLFYGLSVLQDIQPDILHLNAPGGLPIVLAAKLLKMPVVLHVRNGAIEPYGPLISSSDAVVAISEFLKREILAFDLNPNKVHLIPDEADVQHFKNQGFNKQKIRESFGIPLQAKVALMIARFAPNKRHDVMIEAAALVRKSLPSFHLVMKGDVYSQSSADLLESVQTQIRRRGLAKDVTWIRFVPDIRLLHAMADVLVLCSDREGMGRCVVEAMAMELPVVVTDSGGSHELTGNRQRGYVARGGDAKDLAKQILEALTNTSLSEEMVKNARQFAETHLTAQQTARQMMEIYDRLLNVGTINKENELG